MSSAPCCLRERTMERASSAVLTETVKFGLDQESGPSTIGPLATILGPSCWPAAIASRRGKTSLAGPPMLRIPRTPLATYILRSRGASRKCICISQRPGITYMPVPSMTLAEGGSLTAFERPTEAIDRPWMRMVISCKGWGSPGLMMVMWVMARPEDCARRRPCGAANAVRKKRVRRRERNGRRDIGELDAGGEVFVPGMGRGSPALLRRRLQTQEPT